MLEVDESASYAFKVAKTDVSCFFTPPTRLIAWKTQKQAILTVLSSAADRFDQAAAPRKKELLKLRLGPTVVSGDQAF